MLRWTCSKSIYSTSSPPCFSMVEVLGLEALVMGKKAAFYLRVSTTRQAEKDLSIPDQRRQAEEYCQRKGWDITAKFVEPGASATDDKRPAFQRMIDEASLHPSPFDVVIVHSFSRFFRDAYQFEFYRRKLAKHGVEVVSITQELGDDPMDNMVRQILNLFDEYQSKETAKHVLRSMKENARQGYWNGSHPPYGYKAVPVEVRGGITKKKLQIEENEAAIVRDVFALCLKGKGIRAIAHTLNGKGLRYRKGRNFGVSLIHKILTHTTYMGVHHFNKTDSKTRKAKDPSEWVAFDTPVIIANDTFERVQDLLAKRRPSNTPPRIVNGPTLLTGIAKCGTCGGGMTLRTGKGGRYRYYTCNTRATEGKTACEGRNMRMEKLDELVLDQLEKHLFTEERLELIIAELLKRTANQTEDLHREETQLRKSLRETEAKIDRMLDAIAEGLVGNTDGFKRKLSALEQQRDELLRQASSKNRRRDLPIQKLTPENIEQFAEAARQKLRDPDSSFRKGYVGLFVERIDVMDQEIRISGPNAAIAAEALKATKPGTDGVPSFVPKWWAHKDSNLGPAD
ncbi:recombinase family protein [Magnetovibrio sp.]|uniref:recombinase family protein n=1 Tax=Magnetovibrio sp. TaxID=2024836 RepID=UPI0039C9CDBA